MAIKRYCDGCDKEIVRSYASDRLVGGATLKNTTFGIEVMISSDGVANKGDICLSCVAEVFRRVVTGSITETV